MCSKNQSIASYFSLLEPNNINTSFTVPILPQNELLPFIGKLKRFASLKIKVNYNCAFETIQTIAKATNQPLRIDGNESWTNLDDLAKFIDSLAGLPIECIEQPMPASCVKEYKELKQFCPFPLIADESIESLVDFSQIKQQFDGINVKLMKAGSYHNAVYLLSKAKTHNLKTMIGCMIETSLGISSALNLASLADYVDLDGSLIVANEPYDLVKENNGKLSFHQDDH